ncbi:MAG: SGNH/GDSL hydrolase family protein [Anaerolineaceae bacterium]|nr:SGNH/GDSL hydrolase family protein [Anaerolineaceae bacterium]
MIDDRERRTAFSYYRLGKIGAARQIFSKLVRDHPEDDQSWWGLSLCAPTERQKRWCLKKCLEINPNHPQAKKARRRLRHPSAVSFIMEQLQLTREAFHPRVPTRMETILLLVFVALLSGTLSLILVLRQPPEGNHSSSTGQAAPAEAAVFQQTENTLSAPDAQPPTAAETPPTTRNPENWKDFPPVPEISQHALEIFQHGLELGTDPRAFSVIGDCHSDPQVLFGRFEKDDFILPAEYQHLQPTIDYFNGSFARSAPTVRNGMDVGKVFSPYWNDPAQCEPDESPVDCEVRLHNPSVMLISLGTNWMDSDPGKFESYYRQIIEYCLDRGILPIVATKADSSGGYDFPLNRVMVRLAVEYDLPVWNFWATIQHLPYQGLDLSYESGYHIQVGAWEIRRYSGLEVLNAVMEAVNASGLSQSPSRPAP